MRFDLTLLTLDGRTVTIGEVLASSYLGGWMDPLIQSVSDSLACAALAKTEEFEIDAADLQSTVNRWRSKHRLLTAEEMQNWFKEFDLTLDALANFHERQLLLEAYAERLGEAQEAAEIDPAAILSRLPSEALFGNYLERYADDFAMRAVAQPIKEEGVLVSERKALLEERKLSESAQLQGALKTFHVNEESGKWLLDIEATFRLRRRELLTEEALAKGLSQGRSELLRFDAAVAHFENQDAAREALCCIREDGESLDQIAERAGAECDSGCWFQADLNEVPLGPRIATARPGDAIGPEKVRDMFVVAQFVGRIEPQLNDPDVRERLESQILNRTLRREASRRSQLSAEMMERFGRE